VQGDLGFTYAAQRSVTDEIFTRFPNTLQLAVMGLIIAVVLGVSLGIVSAVKQYSVFDNGATIFGILFVSLPNFWLGMMLVILFAVNLGWLPPSGFERPAQWILPAVTLGTGQMAMIMRMSRSSMLEVIRQDYIRTARAKGQKESIVIWNHALRNALIPVTTYVGLMFGWLLSGAVLTETIFSINGIGRLMVQSIRSRELPIVLGSLTVLSVLFSLVNLLVDILYAYLDPRIKSQYK
jgi:peptide/nickel transport system permease protein